MGQILQLGCVCLRCFGSSTFGWTTLVYLALSMAAYGDYVEDLPGGYYFASEANNQQVIVHELWRAGDPYIPCNVEAYDADDRFIVAMQRVTKSCFWGREMEGSHHSVDDHMLFWIVDTKTHEFMGPYSDKGEFEAMRLKHRIAATLD